MMAANWTRMKDDSRGARCASFPSTLKNRRKRLCGLLDLGIVGYYLRSWAGEKVNGGT